MEMKKSCGKSKAMLSGELWCHFSFLVVFLI